MPREMRQMGLDLARAMIVLALVFLNFAHLPAASAAMGADVLVAHVDQSWCGDAPTGDTDTSHAPCHACRVLAAALPPPEDGTVHLRASLPAPLQVAVALAAVRYAQDRPETRAPPRLA